MKLPPPPSPLKQCFPFAFFVFAVGFASWLHVDSLMVFGLGLTTGLITFAVREHPFLVREKPAEWPAKPDDPEPWRESLRGDD